MEVPVRLFDFIFVCLHRGYGLKELIVLNLKRIELFAVFSFLHQYIMYGQSLLLQILLQLCDLALLELDFTLKKLCCLRRACLWLCVRIFLALVMLKLGSKV